MKQRNGAGMRRHRLLLRIITAIALCEIIIRAISFFAFRGRHGGDSVIRDKTTILCIGDSVTFGIGSSAELSYPSLLERKLNGLGIAKYRVINIGFPGYTVAELRRDLHGVLRQYNPDIVVILIGMNDSWKILGLPTSFFSASDSPGYQRMIHVMPLLNKSFLFRLLNLTYMKLKNAVDISKIRQPDKRLSFDHLPSNNKAGLTKHLHATLGQVVCGLLLDKRRVILMTYPRCGSIADKALSDTAAAYAVPLLDLASVFKNLDDSYFINDQFHPNWKGNSVMAGEIGRFLESLRVEPAASSQSVAMQPLEHPLDILYENRNWQPLFEGGKNQEEFDLEDFIRAEKTQRPLGLISWIFGIGVKLATDYGIWKYVMLPQGRYRVRFTAMGTSLYDVFPEVVVRAAVRGASQEPHEIAKFMMEREFKEYTSSPFILQSPSQVSLCIEYTNDAYEAGVGDRNLFIKQIVLERTQNFP